MASEASGNSTGIGERRSVSPPPIRSFKGARLRRGVDAARRHAGGCDRLSIAIPPRWSLVPGWQSVAARPTNGKRRRRYHHGCSPICGVGFGEAQSLRTLWNGRARRSNRSRPVSLVKPEKEAAKRQRRGVCPARFAAHIPRRPVGHPRHFRLSAGIGDRAYEARTSQGLRPYAYLDEKHFALDAWAARPQTILNPTPATVVELQDAQ
jgi:hypothetical protein